MKELSPNSFLVKHKDAPSLNSYVARYIMAIIISLYFVINQYYKGHHFNKYLEFVIFKHLYIFWITSLCILVASFLYALYDERKYKILLNFDENRISVTELYLNSATSERVVLKKDIDDISLQIWDKGGKKWLNNVIYLQLSFKGYVFDSFVIPWSQTGEIFSVIKRFWYPVAASVEQMLTSENETRKFDTFARRLSIAALLFIVIWTYSIVALMTYLGGR